MIYQNLELQIKLLYAKYFTWVNFLRFVHDFVKIFLQVLKKNAYRIRILG